MFIGDWDSHNFTPHGQVATKGKGFRDMFRRAGHKVYLIDEYKTSKTCPLCHGNVETFKHRINPKPWKNNIMDDVATQNMMFIVKETKNTGIRPGVFCK